MIGWATLCLSFVGKIPLASDLFIIWRIEGFIEWRDSDRISEGIGSRERLFFFIAPKIIVSSYSVKSLKDSKHGLVKLAGKDPSVEMCSRLPVNLDFTTSLHKLSMEKKSTKALASSVSPLKSIGNWVAVFSRDKILTIA